MASQNRQSGKARRPTPHHRMSARGAAESFQAKEQAALARFLEKQARRARSQPQEAHEPLRLTESVPPIARPVWDILKAACEQQPERRNLWLRLLLDQPPPHPGVRTLPEPYQMAACLLPKRGWRFVRLALFDRIARNRALLPGERQQARRKLEKGLRSLLRRRPGRPDLDLENLHLLVAMKTTYGELRQGIRNIFDHPSSPGAQRTALVNLVRRVMHRHVDIPDGVLDRATRTGNRADVAPSRAALELLAYVSSVSVKKLGEAILRKEVKQENLKAEFSPDPDY